MNVINTSAPIKIEELKQYFQDKSTFFVIDYTESSIKADKLLTYISNLDIPCDVKINNNDELKELLTVYLSSSFIVNVPILENIVISLLLQHKGIIPVVDSELLEDVKEQLAVWINKLESLALFNLYCIKEDSFVDWVKSHEEDATTSLEGVNFVSLLKNPSFYEFYQSMTTEPKYYSAYFNEYMFKGKNLYTYWSNENNPMFLLTYGISNGLVESDNYADCINTSLSELTPS
jgi:hypothetical protein